MSRLEKHGLCQGLCTCPAIWDHTQAGAPSWRQQCAEAQSHLSSEATSGQLLLIWGSRSPTFSLRLALDWWQVVMASSLPVVPLPALNGLSSAMGLEQ
jgi:hypothetical protein